LLYSGDEMTTDLENKYYATLYRKSRRGRNEIWQSLKWLEDNYTGDARKAFKYKMDAPSWKTTQELKLYNVFKSILNSQKRVIKEMILS